MEELEQRLLHLATDPRFGVEYRWSGHFEARRALLPRTKYHVDHSCDASADLVKVRAIWHAKRRSRPILR